MKKVIGIISYFVEDKSVRDIRKNKLVALINKCNQLFNLPVIIIAQNWTRQEIWQFKNSFNNCIIFEYINKLGITGARKELRKKFLESDFDYLIMFDDDAELHGNSGIKYLKQIEENPGCFIENNKSRLELFAISKEIFAQHDYADVNPEDEGGFEDRIFFYSLCNKFPEKHKKFVNTGLTEFSIATNDSLSTWYENQDIMKMLENTEKEILKNS